MEGSLPPRGFIILSKSDVRWIQRRQNYRTALSRLTAAVALANTTARMTWAIMTSGEPYREPKPAAA